MKNYNFLPDFSLTALMFGAASFTAATFLKIYSSCYPIFVQFLFVILILLRLMRAHIIKASFASAKFLRQLFDDFFPQNCLGIYKSCFC